MKFIDEKIQGLEVYQIGNFITGSFLLPKGEVITWDKTLLEFPFKSKIQVRFAAAGDNIYSMITANKLAVYSSNSSNGVTKNQNYFNFSFVI